MNKANKEEQYSKWLEKQSDTFKEYIKSVNSLATKILVEERQNKLGKISENKGTNNT